MISYTNRIAKALEKIAGIDNAKGSNLNDTQRMYNALETKAGMTEDEKKKKKYRKNTERIADALDIIAENPSGDEPTGSIDITENGVYNVKNVAQANVQVEAKDDGTVTILEGFTWNVSSNNAWFTFGDGKSIEALKSGDVIEYGWSDVTANNNPNDDGVVNNRSYSWELPAVFDEDHIARSPSYYDTVNFSSEGEPVQCSIRLQAVPESIHIECVNEKKDSDLMNIKGLYIKYTPKQ